MLKVPNIILVATNQDAEEHFMWLRLLRRAGYEKHPFTVLYASDGDLYDQIAQRHPDCVVAMGEEALWALLGQGDVMRWVGRAKTIKLYDRVHESNVEVPLVVNFAPDKLLARKGVDYEDDGTPVKKRQGIRNPSRFQGLAVSILRKAFHIAEHGIAVTGTDYLCDPSPENFKVWADMALDHLKQNGGYLSWDIETPYRKGKNEDDLDEEQQQQETTILRISFSHFEGVAVSVPWQGPWMDTIKLLLGYTGDHIGWNIVGFDVPMVERNGIVVGGRVLDFMDGWHLLQSDLDKGLEFVTAIYTDLEPWKHLADEQDKEALYSCIDADAAIRNAVGITEGLKREGLWDEFLHQMDLAHILKAAGTRGNVIDKDRQYALKVELESKLRAMLLQAQDLVMPTFKRAKVYVRKPKEAKGHWEQVLVDRKVRVCSNRECNKTNVNVKHPCLKQGHHIDTVMVPVECWVKTHPGDNATLDEIKDWLSSNGFNPNSGSQLLDYMRKHGHPVGYNPKTEGDTADTKHLMKLAVKYGKAHPIYSHTVELHKVQKALSTYVYGLAPDASGRVHTQYVNAPSTWRLSSRNVNMQNQGKRESNPYAKAARKTIIASPGRVLVQADSSSIEAVMVGYFMGDPDYIDLARKSIHAYVSCKRLGWEFTPENVKRVKAEKAALYESVKQVVHGTSYGMTPYLMHMTRPDLFPTMRMAKETQEFLFQVLPGLPRWQWEVRQYAHKHNYLVNPWKLKHHFYDVFTYKRDPDTHAVLYGPDGQPLIKLGQDGKRAVAFLPQSSAGMFCRDNLVLLGRSEAAPWMGANVSVHDGYCLDVPEDKVDRAVEILCEILTRPIPQMGGLQVGCEVEVGANWGDMKKVKTVTI